jgi:uncharacterized protein DUF4160
MPEIARFFGIVVRIYYRDHPGPHLHAYRGDDLAVLDFHGEVLHGHLPAGSIAILRQWIRAHEAELHENWDLARDRRPVKRIAPWR